MEPYIRNRYCGCGRCRARGLMGAGVVITLGVLFMLENFTHFGFDRSWPILLIVIGALLIGRNSAPTAGHVNPAWTANQYAPGAPANPANPSDPASASFRPQGPTETR